MLLKKEFTYEDFNGEKQTETVYFRLTKAEALEVSADFGDSFRKYVANAIKNKNVGRLIKVVKAILMKAYGERDPDGRRFIKSGKISEEFSQTVIFDQMLENFMMNPESFNEFIQALLPDVDVTSDEARKAGLEVVK